MTVSVKICGISTEDALDAAIEAGADYAGLVFFARSPRNVSLARAGSLARHAGTSIHIAALTVNADDAEIEAIMAHVKPQFLQLHGDESVERVAAIRRLSRVSIIKAIKVKALDDIYNARAYESEADILLFDAQAPAVPGALPGGNGLSFDWTLLPQADLRPNFMLSGGLKSDNVLAALEASGASAVDVSSGVEISPGVKSSQLIRQFIKTAKSFEPAPPVPNAAK